MINLASPLSSSPLISYYKVNIIMVEHWIIFHLHQFRLSLRLGQQKIGISYYPEVMTTFPLQHMVIRPVFKDRNFIWCL
jgi:hypothetical protein